MSYDGPRGPRGAHSPRSSHGPRFRGGRGGGGGRGSRPFNSDARAGRPSDRNFSNQNPTNVRAATTAPNSVSNYSGLNSAKAKDAITGIPILILGAQGCGKSSLINVFFNEPIQNTSNGYEPGTKDFHPIGIRTANHDFTLIDSPGFDNTLMSDKDIFTKLIQFLCCNKTPTMIAGVIYLHAQGTRLGSGALAKNLHFIKHLLGDSFLERLTILLISQPGEQVDHQKLVGPLLDPKSPFYALHASGAQPDVAILEKKSISNILLSYVGKPSMLMSVQNELCRERVPTEGGIDLYLTRWARARDSGSTTNNRTRIVAGALSGIQTQDFLSPAERKKLESQLQELKKRNEEGSSQSQKDLSQYNAILSQLQIHDNFEQKEVVQSLIDLNRHIDDFALSVSLYLTDTYGAPNIPTTQHAFNLPQLKELFEHEEGKASLVQSSTGEGMPLEDFLDVAIRSTLCEQLYKRIFAPFHPGLETSDPRNGYIVALYGRIRETGMYMHFKKVN
ncbi:hypothetical protein RSOLAG22IIIB_07235 [Rhizoctonia solani]|uniref:G domain-containing protein n=1 Tax=Rhizoctonia solani TaxID=456999 RepID=A0A0K6FM01_9AGAM|nr:hypothetical protein RSOLAG22IIIB_07235 [Rhizoctonia solani]